MKSQGDQRVDLAATLRSFWRRDNSPPVIGPCAGCLGAMGENMPTGPIAADWLTLAPEQADEVPLRSWWARPKFHQPRGALLVLPEVFGVNPWVRSVADRWAQLGYGALAIPLFARTAPDLSLGYGPQELQEGRSHKERTTSRTLLLDVARAVRWLRSQGGADGQPLAVGCIGFCFGGHVALLASALEGVAASCVCYGAGVVQGSPGGGPPTLEVLSRPGGRVLLIYGREDPLVPAEDLRAIATAVERAHTHEAGERAQLQTFAAGHGFLCDARADFQPVEAEAAWGTITAFFAETLAEKD
ncbi:MAG: dienelactone hydrolase family protein [Cyanobium sp.]